MSVQPSMPSPRAPGRFDPRHPAPAPAALPCHDFGRCRLDLARELLLRDGVPQTLRRQSFALLCVLVQRAPALVTQEELLDAVWGHRAISASALPQAMRDLRRALADDALRPSYIATQRGRGYRLIPPVHREVDASRAAAGFAPCLIRPWSQLSAANDDRVA